MYHVSPLGASDSATVNVPVVLLLVSVNVSDVWLSMTSASERGIAPTTSTKIVTISTTITKKSKSIEKAS